MFAGGSPQKHQNLGATQPHVYFPRTTLPSWPPFFHLSGALAVAQKLTNQDAAAIIAPKSMLPSARRDVSIGTEANAVAATFQQSSLMASGWTEPEPSKTDDIFATMIQSVVSGKATPGEAVSQAAQALSALIPTIQ